MRQTIAESLQAKPHEIIFNSGGTEGDNTAILAVAFLVKRKENILLLRQLNIPLCYERWNT